MNDNIAAKAQVNSSFNPVTIEITFGTQEDLDMFGSLMNWTFIADRKRLGPATLQAWSDPIARAVREVGGDIHQIGEWQKYHDRKCQRRDNAN